jgi:hypothetical protein
MKVNKKLKKISIANLIAGYCMVFVLIILVALNRTTTESEAKQEITSNDAEGLFIEKNETKTEIVYVDREISVVKNHSANVDKLARTTTESDTLLTIVENGNLGVTNLSTNNPARERGILIDERGRDFKTFAENEIIYENHKTWDNYDLRDSRGNSVAGNHYDTIHRGSDRGGNISDRNVGVLPESDLLNHRLRELDLKDEVGEYALKENLSRPETNEDLDGAGLQNLTVSRGGDGEDIDFSKLDINSLKGGESKTKRGELYAYNFPKLGVGAGVGSSAVGAGAGGGAGIGAGVGEAIMNGQSVSALGGIGTSPAPAGAPESSLSSGGGMGMPGQPNVSESPLAPSDGVAGLVSGAGAGCAAGLMTKQVSKKLGLGAGIGYPGHGRSLGYEHLPKDGELHIMMHVDGSGSILNTRKQLEIMKDTLLKEALLPYYNNDESLYNNRVSIISDSGERTLKFFAKAAEKENVLAVAFQDEAQPCYHLPNFNKKPEGDYLDDLKALKSKLNNHGGVYRGIMFQVDRGKTFAKSFKEFVGNAFQGEGYLKNKNLKQYYWQNNTFRIKEKNGIVFSDEYHANDEGTPQYYLELLFNASKKIGIDLNIYGAGLTDGQYNTNK